MANRLRQFRLLLWKNFILQLRRPIGTAFEIILPVLLICVLILPKVFIKTEKHCFSTFKPVQSIQTPYLLAAGINETLKRIKEDSSGGNGKANITIEGLRQLVYHPLDPEVDKLMVRVAHSTGLKLVKKKWNSGDDMANEVSQNEHEYFGAIEFYNIEVGKELPKVVKYAIRLSHELAQTTGGRTWRTDRTYPNFQRVGPREQSDYFPQFVALQYAVDMAILQEQKPSNKTPIQINVQALPYPEYIEDQFMTITEGLMPLLMTLAFLYSASVIVKELVNEKHERLKESMKMMGLANWIHWAAWFVKNLVFLLISVIIITAVLKGMKIFEYSDGLVVFLFFLLYAIASISFCFSISVFFSRPTLGMLFTMVLWYCSYVPFEQIQREQAYETLSRSQKAAACLLPNTCLGFATKVFAKFESRQVGVTWEHVSTSPSPDDDFTMAWIFFMLIIESLLYAVITWYVEAVFPGKYGLPRPFYFPFQRSYWCGYSKENIITTEADNQEMGDIDERNKPDIEEENHDLPIGVQIKNLRKVFKGSTGSKVAVDGLSLNMFQNQITALLGHNGAGKTTTMSILTGLFPPTSGSGHVNGKSILTDMGSIRESLGLCPQHNVLFDRLTVKEHLQFFINLKGKFGTEAETEVLQMINDIQLTDKLNWPSSKLSGGMKRKLCCAIALVGGSQTVFLDEPTSGMDPYARRATWDLLLKHKAGRTMILTTHFMDEADFLGDRVAIMADGQLRCCGSSLFLKSRYGVGYHLTLVKKEGCDVNAVTRVIVDYIPSAKLLSSVGAEMEFVLSGEDSKHFEQLFLELENKLDQFGIASFGVSCTTLEEVFMKVGEGAEKTVDDADHEHAVSGQEGQQIVQVSGEEQTDLGELNTGLTLKLQQYKAMFMKRLLNSRREKKAIVTQLVLPLIMVLFGLLLITTSAPNKDDPPRLLRLSNLSVDGQLSKSFYADFRNVTSGNKSSLRDVTVNYLKKVKVESLDVTSKVNKRQTQNEGSHIYVSGNSYEYKNNTADACCKYKYLILNENCKNDFLKGRLNASDCENDDFGYKECQDCLTKGQDRKCLPMGCKATNLKDKNTFFMEYVLEDSNVRDYFNEHVAGFVFGDYKPKLKPPKSGNASSIEAAGTVTTLYYSNQAFHTVAEALSALSNILMKSELGDSYGVETTNHPLPNNAEKKSENVSSDFSALLLAIFFSLGMAFMAASFITFLVQERQSKAKHLQFVSGVDAVSFWFATFTWDFINYLIPMIGIFILFIAFQVDSYNDDLGTLFLLLLIFGMNVLPFVYFTSFLFTSPLIAYALTVFVLYIVSFAMLITVFICQIPAVDLKEEADIMHYVFMLLPTYSISYALIDMNQNYGFKETCTSSELQTLRCDVAGVKYTDDYLDWERPGVGQPALYMFVEAVVLFLLTILVEVRFFIGARVQVTVGNFEPERKHNEDEDVFNERKRVYNMEYADISNEAVVLRDLTKIYRGTNVTAVDHLCLGIPRGTCFGLLGINGAGKTTTFGMLTGDLSISEGTAYMDGCNIQGNLRQVQQRIGYCPQFDALIERLTGREMLTMYANLRGVPANKIKDVVSATIDHLSLSKWADKLCGDYSGGNKRKLSTAIALVGNPPIVFLDEPTTGMDPVARRYLWDSLMTVMKGGRSIVLTSHSMEECEALCSMLAIMVNGQFKCLGAIQHLKSKYGKGYTMMIKVAAEATPPFPGANQAIPPPAYNPAPPPVANMPSAPFPLVFSNPVATGELPDVNEPQKMQDTGVNSRDVNPTIPPAPGPPQAAQPQYPVGMYGLDVAVANVQRFVSETFRGAQLLESHNGMLNYHVDDEGLTWSFIFGQIERNRQKLNIVDYSVSQTSLDQVFINFAKEQHSEERTKVKKRCPCFSC